MPRLFSHLLSFSVRVCLLRSPSARETTTFYYFIFCRSESALFSDAFLSPLVIRFWSFSTTKKKKKFGRDDGSEIYHILSRFLATRRDEPIDIDEESTRKRRRRPLPHFHAFLWEKTPTTAKFGTIFFRFFSFDFWKTCFLTAAFVRAFIARIYMYSRSCWPH